MGVRKWHINPENGDVDRCWEHYEKCPFGSLSVHFYDDKAAYNAADKKLKEFREWNIMSAVPQEEGWFTVHVMNPNSGERIPISPMQRAKTGHRLVLENGWTYEKIDEPYRWKAVAGEMFLPSSPVRHGKIYEIEDLYTDIVRSGARIESNPSLPPYDIEWPYLAR